VNRSLEKIRVRVDGFERVHPPFGSDNRGHLHGEKPDVGAGVDGRVAGFQHAAHVTNFVELIMPAHDVETNHVVGKIDEQPDASVAVAGVVELFDDESPIVGVGVIAVLVLELRRGHQVAP